MATLQSTSRVTVYLTSYRDWNDWFSSTKAYAKSLDIWNFVDPDLTVQPTVPTQSPRPSPSQVRLDATSVVDLRGDDLRQYGDLWKDWKEKKVIYEILDEDLKLFHNHLYSTINLDILCYSLRGNEGSGYRIIKSLKNRFDLLSISSVSSPTAVAVATLISADSPTMSSDISDIATSAALPITAIPIIPEIPAGNSSASPTALAILLPPVLPIVLAFSGNPPDSPIASLATLPIAPAFSGNPFASPIAPAIATPAFAGNPPASPIATLASAGNPPVLPRAPAIATLAPAGNPLASPPALALAILASPENPPENSPVLSTATTALPDPDLPDQPHVTSLHNPSPIYALEADHLITYLRDRKRLSLVVDGNTGMSDGFIKVFEGSSDISYSDDRDTRRSSDQNMVIMSTTEAELLALTHAAKQITWWQRFFKQLGFDPGHEYSLYCDNTQTHWLRERVQDRDLTVEKRSTNEIIADGLTKPLSRQKHDHFM